MDRLGNVVVIGVLHRIGTVGYVIRRVDQLQGALQQGIEIRREDRSEQPWSLGDERCQEQVRRIEAPADPSNDVAKVLANLMRAV